jgi:hypothetical protein
MDLVFVKGRIFDGSSAENIGASFHRREANKQSGDDRMDKRFDQRVCSQGHQDARGESERYSGNRAVVVSCRAMT